MSCVTLGIVSPSVNCGVGGILKIVISQRFSSSKDGNGDSNSKVQATRGTRGHGSRTQLAVLAKAGHRDSGQTELIEESLQ